MIKSVMERNITKKNLVFKNFSIDTNFHKRNIIDAITTKNSILMSGKLDQQSYFEAIASSAFCISPPGNGIDCHRIWECLYLKTIPIVENHKCFDDYRHLPILFVDDWNQITISFLMSKIHLLDKFDNRINELYMSYWKEQII